MTIFWEGTVAHLQGDLTQSGVTSSIIDSLMFFLRQIISVGKKKIHIDCERICAVDISGLQLLYVWIQCARFRGIETKLVNLSDYLQQAMQLMGLGDCFLATFPERETTDMTRAASYQGKAICGEQSVINLA